MVCSRILIQIIRYKAFAHLKVSANFALDKRNSARFYAGSFRYAPLVTTYI